jgi:hypothetical protein
MLLPHPKVATPFLPHFMRNTKTAPPFSTKLLGTETIVAALSHPCDPANILHPSRIIRTYPPRANRPTDALTFTGSPGAFLPIPPDTSEDCRIFVCDPEVLLAHMAMDEFDLGAIFLDVPCYVSLGLQKDWQLHPEHFVDGFYARVENGRLCLLFSTICPAQSYSVPVNLNTSPDVMLESSLEWEMGESLGDVIKAYLACELRKNVKFPRVMIEEMIRMAITALDFIEEHRGEFRLGYPGFPDVPVCDTDPAARRAGILAAFIRP